MGYRIIGPYFSIGAKTGFSSHMSGLCNAMADILPKGDLTIETPIPQPMPPETPIKIITALQRKPKPDDIIINIMQPQSAQLYLSQRDYSKLFQYCIFEGDRLPAFWIPILNDKRISGIVVPSEKTKEACLKSGVTNKIIVIPHGYDLQIFKPNISISKEMKKLKDGKFCFIWNKGWLQGERDRSGLEIFLRAFCAEFKPDEDVKAIVHINPAYYPDPQIALQATTAAIARLELPQEKPNITICTDNFTEKQMAELYNIGEIFVSTSKAESFDIPCLPNGEKIITKTGLKNIADIKTGEKVLTHRGNFMRVNRVMERNYVGNLIKIRPYGFYKDIALTEEHPCLVIKRPAKGKQNMQWHKQKQVWLQAKDIQKGDCLITPAPYGRNVRYIDMYTDLDKRLKRTKDFVWSVTCPRKKYKRKLNLDLQLARLIGYYIAEGSGNKNTHYLVNFSFNRKETQYINEVIEAMQYHFGISPKIDYPTMNGLRLTYTGMPPSLFFAKFCGIGSHNKKIPNFILYGAKDLLAETIRCIENGDGYKTTKQTIVSTVSEQLANDLRMAYIRLKRKPSIQKDKRNCYVIRTGKNNMNYSHSNKSWWVKYGKLATLIRTIKKEQFNGKVYNLEIEKHNTYCPYGYIVHNCIESLACGCDLILGEHHPLIGLTGNKIKSVRSPATDANPLYEGVNWWLMDQKELQKEMRACYENKEFYKVNREYFANKAEGYKWEDAAKKLVNAAKET